MLYASDLIRRFFITPSRDCRPVHGVRYYPRNSRMMLVTVLAKSFGYSLQSRLVGATPVQSSEFMGQDKNMMYLPAIS